MKAHRPSCVYTGHTPHFAVQSPRHYHGFGARKASPSLPIGGKGPVRLDFLLHSDPYVDRLRLDGGEAHYVEFLQESRCDILRSARPSFVSAWPACSAQPPLPKAQRMCCCYWPCCSPEGLLSKPKGTCWPTPCLVRPPTRRGRVPVFVTRLPRLPLLPRPCPPGKGTATPSTSSYTFFLL